VRAPAWAAAALGVAAAALGGCSDDPADDTSYNCAKETRDDDYVAGLAKVGDAGRYELRLMTAAPAPPARGDNSWVIQVSATATATPVGGAALTVTPFMPDHAHGSGKTVVVTPEAAAGQYKLEPVNLWMPGLWEVTVQVTGAAPDRAVFRFCLST
jgi:hypothetical protein